MPRTWFLQLPTAARWLVAIGAMAVAAAACIAVLVLLQRAQPSDLDRLVAEYRQLGFPWTSEELQAPLQVPDEQNAAPILLELAQRMRATEVTADLKRLRTALSSSDLATIEDVVTTHTALIDLLRSAAKRPGLYVRRDYDLRFDIVYPDIVAAKQACELVRGRMVLAAQRGRLTEALSDARTLRQVSRLLAHEPDVIPALVSFVPDDYLYMSTSDVLPAFAADQGALLALRRLFESPSQASFRNMIQSEAYTAVTFCRNISMFTSKRLDRTRIQRSGVPDSSAGKRALTSVLTFWVRAGRLMQEAGLSDLELAARLQQLLDEWPEKDPMLRLLIPDFTTLARRVAQTEARRRCAVAAVTVIQFRAANAMLPSRAEEMSDWPVDPFTDRPLAYRREPGESFLVYSAGPDGTDDRGAPRPKVDDPPLSGWDIVMRVDLG